MHTRQCNIAGNYCWTCQRPTGRTPGWTKPPRDESIVIRSPWGGCLYSDAGGMVGYYGFTEAIIWANGDTEDSKRGYRCVVCSHSACPAPVSGGVEYNEIVTGRSYWAWAEAHGAHETESGLLAEPPMANPDSLQG